MKNSAFMNTRPELDQDHDISTTSGRDKSQVQVLFYFMFMSITWYQLRRYIIATEKFHDDFHEDDLKECKIEITMIQYISHIQVNTTSSGRNKDIVKVAFKSEIMSIT